MKFQQVALFLAVGLIIAVFALTIPEITGFAVKTPTNAEFSETLIQPTYSDLGGGICECDSCADCTDALNDPLCTEVKLNQSINSIGTCIDTPINLTNKTFDCDTNSITGDLSGVAINLFDNNLTTIKNCTISNFSYGVVINNSWWCMLANSTIENNLNGILVLNSSWQAVISFNNFTNNTNMDIAVKDNSPLFVSGFNIFNLSNVGVSIYNTTQTRILNSIFYNTSTIAINSTESEDTFIFDTEMSDCLDKCVIFENGKDNWVENVTVLGAVGDAFIFKNQEEIELRNISVKNVLGAGIVIDNTTFLEDIYNLEDLFYLENNTYGLRIFDCLGTITIANSNITKNVVGVWANTSALNVHYNNLWNNTNFSVQNVNSSMNVGAASNWWNTTTTPSTGATTPKNASLNVTVGEWLKSPVIIDTPVYVALPLNGSYTNATIYFNLFTNRNATCGYNRQPDSFISFQPPGITGGTNHTLNITLGGAVDGERIYYFSCLDDSSRTRTNNTTIIMDLTSPTITAIRLDSITENEINLSWNTTENTTTKTYYRASTPPTTSPLGLLNNTIPSTTHTANINHPLNYGTTYYVQVYAYDHVFNPTNTTIYRFVTENTTSFDFPSSNNTTLTFSKVSLLMRANIQEVGCILSVSESTLPLFTTIPQLGVTYINITPNSYLANAINWTQIKYNYTESELTAKGINASTLKMYRYNETATAWQLIDESEVNTTGKYVWANVTEFSYFAVVGQLSNGVACTSDTQCGENSACLEDYDGEGSWCGPETNCAHDGNVSILTNTYRCDPDDLNDSLKCSSGEWIRTTCGLGCDSATGTCKTSSPVTGGPGTSSGTTNTTSTAITAITFLWTTILPNAPVTAVLTNENISISKVIVNVNETVSGELSLKIGQFKEKPSILPNLTDVYAYLEVTPQNMPSSKISSVKIEFSIDTIWLTANGISPESVVLQRYTTQWNPLETNYLGTSGNKSLFSATLPGFSYFAITGRVVDEPITQPIETNETEPPIIAEYCGDGTCQINEDCLICPTDCGICSSQEETETKTQSSTIYVILLVGIISAVAFAVVYFKFLRKEEGFEKPASSQSYAPIYPQYRSSRTQPTTPPDKEHQLDAYVNKMLGKGVSEEQIRTALKNVGWNSKTIEKVIVLGKLPPQYLEKVESYANIMLQKGVSKEIIKQRLMAKRWPEDIVNQILNK